MNPPNNLKNAFCVRSFLSDAKREAPAFTTDTPAEGAAVSVDFGEPVGDEAEPEVGFCANRSAVDSGADCASVSHGFDRFPQS